MEKASLRIICFHDYSTDLLIKTDVPAEIIEQAIIYRNQKLDEKDYSKCDYEYIEDYIWSIDSEFTFECIGGLEDLPTYNW